MGIDYLYIRLLEACNSRCEMCRMAGSADPYRLSVDSFQSILRTAERDGIKYIRFTGGEPLLHKDILLFIKMIRESGLRSSIITNGLLLGKKIKELSACGLDHVVVSLDGPSDVHERIRGVKGIYDRAVEGLKKAYHYGIHTRVNTVCGPKNYAYMPILQKVLTELEIEQWELSTLKLDMPLQYSNDDIPNIEHVNKVIYENDRDRALVPMGKWWSGRTQLEKRSYFDDGIPPRPDHKCHIVDRVRYISAKDSSIYVCSLLPHRENVIPSFIHFDEHNECSFGSRVISEQAEYFKDNGPIECRGCSATAAGCSNDIELGRTLEEWYY